MSALISAAWGGVFIGLAATLYWAANWRIAGVSGIVRAAVAGDEAGARREPVAFLLGLISAGLVASLFRAPPVVVGQPLAVALVGGVLVGFGTRVGGGCTSGHGVCGISRVRPRSIVATLTFMALGALTVALVARAVPSWMMAR
jgi:uncharacterized membrane protein YedE/YeeE